MLVRDILNLKGGTIYTIAADEPLELAVRLMVEHDVGSLVVMDGGRMAGMLTFREILQALNDRRELAKTQACELMVADPLCGNPGDTMDDLRELMTQHHVRYLPVCDGEKLLGVVSFHDVAKAVIKQTSMENRLLRRYIESQPADPTPRH